MTDLVRQASWAPDWQRADLLPDGPVELWLVMYSDDRRLLGGGPVTAPVTWAWRNGSLCCAYGNVRMTARHPGRLHRFLIVAVSAATGLYTPVFDVPVTNRADPVEPGNMITVTDGVIRITPTADQRPPHPF